MFSRTTRFILIVAAVIVGILSLERQPWLAIGYFVGSGFLLVGFFRAGTVWLAYRAAKKDDRVRTWRLLGQIADPKWLARQQRAYYHLLRGGLLLDEQNSAGALPELRTALDLGLRTGNDRRLALLGLGEAWMMNGDPMQAIESIGAARRETSNAHHERLADLERKLGIEQQP